MSQPGPLNPEALQRQAIITVDESTDLSPQPIPFHARHSLLMLILFGTVLLSVLFLLLQNHHLRREADLHQRQIRFREQVAAIDRQALTRQPSTEPGPARDFFCSLLRKCASPNSVLLLINNEGQILAPAPLDRGNAPQSQKFRDYYTDELKTAAAHLSASPAWQRVRLGSGSFVRAPLDNTPWQAVLIQHPPSLVASVSSSLEGGTLTALLVLFSALCAFQLFTHRHMIRPSAQLFCYINDLAHSKIPLLDQQPPAAWRPWFSRIESIFRKHQTLVEQNQRELDDLERLLKERSEELERLTQNLRDERAERSRAENALRAANRQVRELSLVDGLTGLPNYRKFREYLNLYWTQLMREKKPVSIVVCNVDALEHYNDAYGHQAGDRCLQEIATAIKAALRRPNDLVARHGSEKFMILLPGIDLAGTKRVANGIQQALASLYLDRFGAQAASCINFSIGMATRIPTYQEPAEKLVQAATQSLCRAKQTMGNPLRLCPEGPSPEPSGRSNDEGL